jgi:hypothetical protein
VHFWTDNKAMGVQTITRVGKVIVGQGIRPLGGFRKKKVDFVSSIKIEHRELTVAGWGYRMKDRGWIIYRHPQTRRWHTRPEAAAIIAAGLTSRVRNTPNVSELSL